MKSTASESIVTLTAGKSAGLAAPSREDHPTPRRAHWGALYAILLASVGLCMGGSRLVTAVGHSAWIQYGVALAIIGLLVAWVRSNRSSLSSDVPGPYAQPRQPFSVIHVAFSPNTVGSGQCAPRVRPGASNAAGPTRPVTEASLR